MIVFFDNIMILVKIKGIGNNCKKILEVIRQEKLYTKISKNECCKEEIGYIVSTKGISVNPKKIKAVREWKKSVSLHEVRSTLRMDNCFIKCLCGISPK